MCWPAHRVHSHSTAPAAWPPWGAPRCQGWSTFYIVKRKQYFFTCIFVYAFVVNHWYCRVSLCFCTIHTFICLNLPMTEFFVQTQQQFGGRWWWLKMMFLSRTIQQQGHCLYFLSSLFYQCELFYGPKYLLVEKDAKFGCLSSSNPRLSSSFYKKSFCSD